MGCEGVAAGDDVMTMNGDALKENGDGRHVNDVWWEGESPEPPSSLLAGDNDTAHTVRKVSMLSVVLLPSVQHGCYSPEKHIAPLELLPVFLASLELPAPSRLSLPPRPRAAAR